MQIQRIEQDTIRLARIDPFLADLLLQIAPSANPRGSEAARRRFFSPPSMDAAEEGFVEDWREFVEPGLRHIFEEAIAVIERDLGGMVSVENSEEQTLDIRAAHLESWIHGLNQARLALAARYEVEEDDMDDSTPIIADERAFALLQIRFYGLLEAWFLDELDPL